MEDLEIPLYDPAKSYCGPWWMTIPRCMVPDDLNILCFKHDWFYGMLGDWAYNTFNVADQELLNEIAQMSNKSVLARIVETVFTIKKRLC